VAATIGSRLLQSCLLLGNRACGKANRGKAICAGFWGRVPKRQSSTDFVQLYSFIPLVGDPMAGLTGHAAIGNRQAYGAAAPAPDGLDAAGRPA
jgi:hypothetical protein